MTTETWTGSTSTGWNVAANWSGDTVPQAGDTAMIQPVTTHVAAAPPALTAERIVMAGGSGTGYPFLDVSNATLGAGTVLQTLGSLSLTEVSLATAGTLTVAAGAVIAIEPSSGTASLIVGNVSGSGDRIVNNGLIAAAPNTTLWLAANLPAGSAAPGGLANNGQIIVVGGTLEIDSAGQSVPPPPTGLAGRGTIHIRDGGTPGIAKSLCSPAVPSPSTTGPVYCSSAPALMVASFARTPAVS